jgi:Bacteriophage head to tail connecting protein
MAGESTPRDRLFTRWGALKSERSTWMTHYKEISDAILPRSGRFFVQDRNRGQKRHNNILDNTGTKALRVLAAGMMAGMTSPARPWFRLATPDDDLNKSPAVKLWLAQVTRMMLDIFAKSNTYRALHTGYEELGAFGTMASIIMPDYKNVIHQYPLTTGEYCIAQNWKGEVCTLYREFEKTVGEMVAEFGLDKCSTAVQNLWKNGALDQWITIVHAIEPRTDRDTSKRDNLNMAWKSVYFELNNADKTKYLSEGGFKKFPALAARWATIGGDVYGNSPGMDALGDVRQLQHEQLRKAQVIDYQSNPPIQVPASMKGRDVDTLPGGISYVDVAGPAGAIKTAFDVSLNLQHLLEDLQDVRERIRSAFSADLFLMLANSTNTQMTATEVAERHEEKLLMLGPVLERLHSELLDPLIDTTFEHMVAANILPPPPPEMHGMQLNVQFVSMLAQAQRAIATNSIDRFVGNLGQVASFKPEVLDKLDTDMWADKYSDMLGVDPEFIVANDKVAIIRQQRAKAQQAAQATAQAEQAASALAKAGTVQTPTGNAGADVMRAFSGYQ